MQASTVQGIVAIVGSALYYFAPEFNYSQEVQQAVGLIAGLLLGGIMIKKDGVTDRLFK